MTAIEEEIEQGIQQIIRLASAEILVIKTPEHKQKIETAVRGIIEAYANSKVAALTQQHEREIANKIFIDIPTGHEITQISKVHEPECSTSRASGFMCDCSVLKAAQYAVDKAKERVLQQQSNGDKV